MIISIIVATVHRYGDSRNVLKEVSKRQDAQWQRMLDIAKE